MSTTITARPVATSDRKSAGTIKETFPVLEMTCAACAISVESMLKSVPGVQDAGVNFANQSAWVQYGKGAVTHEELQSAVRAIGYDLVIDLENQDEVKEEAQQRHYREVKQRTIWSSILSLPIVIIGMFFMDMPYGN
ncbi:cation transporter, partial [uncultured Chitinophaga sp.]